MKKCDMCKEFNGVECYGKNRRNKDGLHTTCKECKKRLDKDYVEKNKDKIKKRRQEYYKKNREKIIDKVNEYIPKNRDKRRRHGVTARKKYKTKAFQAYCDGFIKCAYCLECEFDLLTIDHIHGQGNEHRKFNNIQAGCDTYRWLKRNGYPPGFQVLCYNCQFRKKHIDAKPANPTHRQIQRMNYYAGIKKTCMEMYGGICRCGESDLMVLSLDHTNDDGAEHRRSLNKSGAAFYLHLRKNGFPNDPPLQVLCMSCQMRKRFGLSPKEICSEQGKDGQAVIDQDAAFPI